MRHEGQHWVLFSSPALARTALADLLAHTRSYVALMLLQTTLRKQVRGFAVRFSGVSYSRITIWFVDLLTYALVGH